MKSEMINETTKKYVITCDDDYNILHQNMGGGAYIAIAHGTHNELARYIKAHNINMDEEVQ